MENENKQALNAQTTGEMAGQMAEWVKERMTGEVSPKSFIEIKARVVGNTQAEETSDSTIAGGKRTSIKEFLTVVPQKSFRNSFALDVSDTPWEFLIPGTPVTIRITKD